MSFGANDLPQVGIVVLNWNRPSETLECLESLASLDYDRREVLVVDNGSTDESIDVLRNRPGGRLLETGLNLGFGAGMNKGIQNLLDLGAEYVWVLNNDTVVAPRSLRILVDDLTAHPEAGAASPKILFKGGNTIWYAGGEFMPALAAVRRRGAGRPDRGEWDTTEEVTFVTGCSLLIRRQALEGVGLFKEHYFLYFEDVEFGHRLLEHGWRLRYVPEAVIWHTGGGSSDEPGGTSAQFDYFNTRNLLWFITEHLSGTRRAVATFYTLLYVAKRSVKVLTSPERQAARKLKALAHGLRDGLSGSKASH